MRLETVGGRIFKNRDNKMVEYNVFIAVSFPRIFVPKETKGYLKPSL